MLTKTDSELQPIGGYTILFILHVSNNQ